jgi:GxxExxY protein
MRRWAVQARLTKISGMTKYEHDPLTFEIIGAAIEVHRHFGPGILESAYEKCLCFELGLRGIEFRRQVPIPIIYKGLEVEFGFRPDLIVKNEVVVELKCVETLSSVHDAQVLTYMRLTGLETGLVINFQCHPLVKGIKRFSLKNSVVSVVSVSNTALRGQIPSPGTESGPE